MVALEKGEIRIPHNVLTVVILSSLLRLVAVLLTLFSVLKYTL